MERLGFKSGLDEEMAEVEPRENKRVRRESEGFLAGVDRLDKTTRKWIFGGYYGMLNR